MWANQSELDLSLRLPHHGEHAEAGLAQQVAQIGDGRVGGHPGGEAPLSLRLGQLQGAAQLVQAFPAHHGPDEHAVRLQHLEDLRGGGGGLEVQGGREVSGKRPNVMRVSPGLSAGGAATTKFNIFQQEDSTFPSLSLCIIVYNIACLITLVTFSSCCKCTFLL